MRNRTGGPRLTRREAVAPMLGLVALPVLAARAQTFDDPPVFRTLRYQFTLVQPPVRLPAMALTNLAGRPARLAPVAGKVLLVNVWATWCDACKLDLPLLDRFQETVGGRVKVAAVSTDRADRARVAVYLDRLSIRHLAIYLDPDRRLASSDAGSPVPLPIYGMPITYLVTPSGRVAGYICGSADWLAEDAQALLAYYASA